MDAIAIDFGAFTITWYAIFIVSGMIIGIYLVSKEANKHHISKQLLYDFIFNLLIFGFIGARLWYVVFDLNVYINHPLSILAIWQGGLAIHGGLSAGALYMIYFTKKHQIKPFLLSDLAVPALLLAQSIGRFGNFTNQEAHGGETTQSFLANTLHLPNFIVEGMNINGVYYQPTFLYEAVWNFIGFLLVMLVLKRFWRFKYGYLTAFYLIWYGFIRTFIEMMRTDALLLGPIKVAQVASIMMVILGVCLVSYLKRSKNVSNRN